MWDREDTFQAQRLVILAIGFAEILHQIIKISPERFAPHGIEFHVRAILREVEHLVRNLHLVVFRQALRKLGLGFKNEMVMPPI